MANAKHLEILKSGVENWNEWKKENQRVLPDLKGANLVRAYLEGANLKGANLYGANLEGAYLESANLEGACLESAYLKGANLMGANLMNAMLVRANLKGAYLMGANLEAARMLLAYLMGAYLMGANLKGANLMIANLEGAYLMGANLKGANLEGANLKRANLKGANLEGANLVIVYLEGANLEGANLEGANLRRLTVEVVIPEPQVDYHTPSPIPPLQFRRLDMYSLNFDGIFPSPFHSNTWQDLLVYVYFEFALEKVLFDFEQRKRSLSGTYSGTTAVSQSQIPRYSLLTIIPEIPSVVCNPPSLKFRMTEDYHCLQFRVTHQPTLLIQTLERGRVNGTIRIYLETLLIGEIPVDSEWEMPNAMPLMRTALVSSIVPQSEADTNKDDFKRQTAQQFRKIFASYCHKDIQIVERLEKAYLVLGDDYWRDLQKLQSGENWSDAIEKAINDCDVFQLCWSSNAKTSEYVEIEWRTALKRKLIGLIRPIYWEKSLPEPPSELSHLHFAHYPLEE